MKKPFRFYLSVFGGKLMIKLMRMMKRNATNLPGEASLIFFPKLLHYIDMPEKVIVITGTNGKTTVSNMISDILEGNGYEFISNRFGGNVDTGIASILLDNCTFGGKCRAKMAVFEVDERSAGRILPFVKPDYLVCTNLQRDSMKRNAHTEYIFNFLNSNISDNTKLILNADDIISSALKPNNDRAYFGIRRQPDEESNDKSIICDAVLCPKCKAHLIFDFKRYNHIGEVHCEKCGYKNPSPNYCVEKIDYENRKLVINHNGTSEEYPLVEKRITDIYNTSAVVALTRDFGVAHNDVVKILSKAKIVKTRYDNYKIGNHEIVISLAKGQNPVACSGVCHSMSKESGNKAIIMILEDFYDAQKTSENLAWIYETDFEYLKDDSIKQIIVGGKRCSDYLLRLLMAGIDKDKISICDSETDTVSFLKPENVEKILIMYDLFNTKSLNEIKGQLEEKLGGK